MESQSKRRMTTTAMRKIKSSNNLSKRTKVMMKYLTLERSKWTFSKFDADRFYAVLLLKKLRRKLMKENHFL